MTILKEYPAGQPNSWQVWLPPLTRSLLDIENALADQNPFLLDGILAVQQKSPAAWKTGRKQILSIRSPGDVPALEGHE